MTRGRARVHFDTQAPGPLRKALCGWSAVDVETDVTKVTCKTCLAQLAGLQQLKRSGTRAARRSGTQALSADDVQRQLAEAFRATLAPSAGAPPRITAQTWALSCKGAEHRRCGLCEICEWERSAQLWSAVAPWNKSHALGRAEGAPRWPSLTAALLAFVEFERHDRCGPSALGGILDRVKRGATDAGGSSARPDDPLLRRAGELVRVRQALELAYPEGGHALPAAKCQALLLLRTPGAVTEKDESGVARMPTYEALAALFETSAGELQALVRAGRKRVGDELAARGLIPQPRLVHRGAVASATYSEVRS